MEKKGRLCKKDNANNGGSDMVKGTTPGNMLVDGEQDTVILAR